MVVSQRVSEPSTETAWPALTRVVVAVVAHHIQAMATHVLKRVANDSQQVPDRQIGDTRDLPGMRYLLPSWISMLSCAVESPRWISNVQQPTSGKVQPVPHS